MFVYCNICSHSLIGNTQSKILKVIPIDSKNVSHGKLNDFTFNPEIFIPIEQKSINNIEISLRGEDGELYPLSYGRSMCTLHFRRKKSI